jgi:hypothetical protein
MCSSSSASASRASSSSVTLASIPPLYDRELAKLEQQKKYVVIGLIVGMQFLLYMMFNFYFFHIINEEISK